MNSYTSSSDDDDNRSETSSGVSEEGEVILLHRPRERDRVGIPMRELTSEPSLSQPKEEHPPARQPPPCLAHNTDLALLWMALDKCHADIRCARQLMQGRADDAKALIRERMNQFRRQVDTSEDLLVGTIDQAFEERRVQLVECSTDIAGILHQVHIQQAELNNEGNRNPMSPKAVLTEHLRRDCLLKACGEVAVSAQSSIDAAHNTARMIRDAPVFRTPLTIVPVLEALRTLV